MDVRDRLQSARSVGVRIVLGLGAISLGLLNAACASAPPLPTSDHPVRDAVEAHMARAAADALAKRALGVDGVKNKALPCAGRDGSISPACAKANGLK